MTWKIITIASAAILACSLTIAWNNHSDIQQQKQRLKRQQTTLDSRIDQLSNLTEEIVVHKQSIQNLQDGIEGVKISKVDTDNQIVSAESEIHLLTAELEQLQAQLEMNRKVDFAEIEKLQDQIVSSRKEVQYLEMQTVRQEGIIAVSEAQLQSLVERQTKLETLRSNQSRGIIGGGFQSTIHAAYQSWGMVIINGGNESGVVNDAQLDVFRDGQFIAKLLVTQVGARQSIADIVPGSQVAGLSLLPGDTITHNPESL